ncbi:hypothetical protein AB6A23_26615 [Paenibacillus tarimensis]
MVLVEVLFDRFVIDGAAQEQNVVRKEKVNLQKEIELSNRRKRNWMKFHIPEKADGESLFS